MVREMSRRLPTLLETIKWQHTVFALPMALAGAALAASRSEPHGALWWMWRVALIVAACAAARTAAMTYNRLVDRDIDATNPRTAARPSVTGDVTPRFMGVTVLVCGALFVGIAALLNPLALALSVPLLLVLLGYSHAKRFTVLAHLWLGAALGLSPLGAWIAILGEIAWPPIALGLAVLLWVGGFDILYALADIEHDQREGLHSIPARLGARRAMDIAALLHILAFATLATLALTVPLGGWYFTAVLIGGALLLLQHRLVQPDDLSRLPTAFLTLNGLFSLAILLGVVLDLWTAG